MALKGSLGSTVPESAPELEPTLELDDDPEPAEAAPPDGAPEEESESTVAPDEDDVPDEAATPEPELTGAASVPPGVE